MDTLLSNLVKLQNMLDQVLSAGAGSSSKLTKSGKPRKVSDRKGKTTARSDFNTMICKEKAAEYEAFKATLASKRGAHITFASNYKEQHPEVYADFEAKWQAKQQEQLAPLEAAAPAAPAAPAPAAPAASASTVPAAASPVAQLITQIVTKTAKKPVKTAKKAITTEVVAPIQASIPDELLPFAIGDKTFLRLGTRRENGNHLWTSGHLWMSKKGAKGGHYGELREDGSINMEAEEPVC
jgi:hypothetical protein